MRPWAQTSRAFVLASWLKPSGSSWFQIISCAAVAVKRQGRIWGISRSDDVARPQARSFREGINLQIGALNGQLSLQEGIATVPTFGKGKKGPRMRKETTLPIAERMENVFIAEKSIDPGENIALPEACRRPGLSTDLRHGDVPGALRQLLAGK